MAAQAAAESCLEALQDEDEPSTDGAGGDADAADVDVAWVRAILPVADALDRVVAQAAVLAEPRAPEPRRMFSFGRPEPRADPGAGALLEGLKVLRAQLLAALEGRGVVVDRRTGAPVDPEVHRVVEVRGAGAGREIVAEIVRPGYRVGGRLVREAEVVVRRG